MAMWTCPACNYEMDDSIFQACPFDGTPKDQAGNAPSGQSSIPKPSPTAAALSETAPAWTNSDEARITTAPVATPSEAPRRRIHADPLDLNDSELVLVESYSGEEIRISDRSCVLGREGRYRPELFSKKVSRLHLEINHEDDKWTASFLGLNDTYLSSRTDGHLKMVSGLEYPLHSGDKIRFPDNLSFLVRIEAKQDEEPSEGPVSQQAETQVSVAETAVVEYAQPSDDLVEGWFIQCNKCGSIFQVEDGSSRMNECPRCIDAMDKRDIKRSTAAFGQRNARAVIDVR